MVLNMIFHLFGFDDMTVDMLMVASVCQTPVVSDMISTCLDVIRGYLIMLMIASVCQVHVVPNRIPYK